MHERTSRALARLLFVGCCAIPTAVTLLTIIVTWTPWYHQRCLRALELELNAATGLSFSIKDFDRRTPQQMELSGVSIHHPETLNEVLSVASVTWQSDDHANVLQVRHPELQAGEINAAIRLIHDRYLCDPSLTEVPLDLTLVGFTIHDGDDALTFENVEAIVTPQPSTVQVQLQARLSGDLSGRTIQANVTRDRSGMVPVTNWHLSTNNTVIPCSVLSPYLQPLASLGNEATFSGVMGCEAKQGQSQLNLSGSNFWNIDLTRFTQDWPHRLSGYADVKFARCEITKERSRDIAGHFESRSGFLHAGLIGPLETHFGCKFDDQVREASDIAYDLISFDFMTDGTRLRVGATCNRDRHHTFLDDHTLICDSERAIARLLPPDNDSAIPAANLAYLLAPPQSPLVPFTPLSEAMLHWLEPDQVAPRDRILRIGKRNQNVPPDQVIRR